MNDDYYDLLGVSRDASTDEIKKAYRKTARSLHPDVNPDPEAQEQYKKVSQAYETLSNPEKRRMYDLGGGPGNPMGGGFSGGSFDFGDLFDMFAGASGMRGRAQGPIPRQRRGNDLQRRISVSLKDVVFGTEREITYRGAILCPECEGSCCAPGTSPTRCTVCGGSGHVQRVAQSLLGQMVTMSPCSACQGHGDIIQNPCQECSGHGRIQSERTTTLRIPSGIEDGVRMQVRGGGDVGEAGGPSGDLLVMITIEPDELYSRDGDDLLTVVRVPMVAAALGTSVPMATFDGERTLEVKAGSQPGDVLTLKGLGITAMRSEKRGDLRARLEVVIPRDMTRDQRRLLEEFAGARGDEQGEQPTRRQHGGVFSKLRDAFRER